MYRHLIWLFLLSPCLFADGKNCDDEWVDTLDEDGYLETPREVNYGGMKIFCQWGCGIPDYDYQMKKIWCLLESTVNTAFYGSPLRFKRPVYSSHFFYTWEIDIDMSECQIYDWPNADGFYNEKRPYQTFPLLTHSQFLDIAFLLRRDLRFYCLDVFQKELNIYKAALPQLEQARDAREYRYVEFSETGRLEFKESGLFDQRIDITIQQLEEKVSDLETKIPGYFLENYEIQRERTEKVIHEIDSLFRSIFQNCLEQHQYEGIAFKGALEDFLGGDFDQAISKIRGMIEIAEKNRTEEQMLAKLYFLKGQIHSEFCLYSDAIVDLTKAIQKNPDLKEAYFERAFAYFELGQFDQAIEDYLTSGIRPSTINATQLGLGMATGVLGGMNSTLVDFVPSVWGAVKNVGEGIWAFAQSPIEVTQEIAEVAVRCIEYLRSEPLVGVVQDMVPELRDLLHNYDKLNDFEKGKQIGYITGKYGTEILCAKYSVKAIKAYVHFKKINRLGTLEMLSLGEKQQLSKATKKVWETRDQIRKGVLKIDETKQGKHIVGHRNYERLLYQEKKPSILTHLDPQKLVQRYAGTGIKDGGGAPGIAGYREIVNFEEVIGYAVDIDTGVETATTWGKIHYAKDGVHIVPYQPR